MSYEWSDQRYVRALHSSINHPKFLGLTAAERGTWLVALLLADVAFPGEVHELAVLKECSDASFERLYERGLLERGEREGWFVVHDLKQFHVTPSSTPEAVRDRKRRSRERLAQEVTDVTPVTDVTDVTDVTVVTTDETKRNELPSDSPSLRSVESESGVGLVGPRDGGRHRSPSRIGA